MSSGALAATAFLGCRSAEVSRAPAIASIAQRRVVQSLPGVASDDGAGVHLTRVIGQTALRNLDPFLLLDRIHSDDPAAYVRGFPDHPHRGFETVTVMLEGAMRHRDSRGNHGLITGGGAQWMTAGRGIVHSEMPEQAHGMLHGFQLWVNLPARTRARVISGRMNGLVGPVRERPTAPTLLTLSLADDAPFELEVADDHTVFAFVYGGSVLVGPDEAVARATRIGEGTLAVLGPGNRVRLRAPEEASGVLLAAARPLREPIAQRGPFVMNTEAEIERAFADYRAGALDAS